MTSKIIRIGGATGFWGESVLAMDDLLKHGDLDYLVFDFLAEITMSIMARARMANADAGYALDFVSTFIEPRLEEIAKRGVKVIANAGGVNATACGAALRDAVAQHGLNLKVAVVTGDDLSHRVDELAGQKVTEMFSGERFPAPDKIASSNAYLGAYPIAQALASGADIVVTGRVVDSAVTLGACIHEFDLNPDDLSALAGASLAGHILECTAQATGGNFTDWELVADNYESVGHPIAEVSADGSFICTKPPGTGGIVTPHTVGEQMLYEIGDPQAYILPDVVCDFSSVTLEQVGPNRVLVKGAEGAPAPDTYKVSATFADGYRGGQVVFFYGAEADRKARRFAEATIARTNRRLRELGLVDLTETCVEIIGDESHYGARRQVSGSREVALKIAAKHPTSKGISVMLKELIGLALASPPGLSMFAGGRPKPTPVVRLFSFLIAKDEVPVAIEVEGQTFDADQITGQAFDAGNIQRPSPPNPPANPSVEMRQVPLIKLAVGRSGDKGNNANIGILARRPEYLPHIWGSLTEQVVRDGFAHFIEGPVERFLLPGSHSINFLLHDVLGGGGVASLRNDPQGKGYAQLLLDFPIAVPAAMAEAL
ncbi:MAG: acyclic terpene utilization AtuA family protein [Pseudomonadota bacterium]